MNTIKYIILINKKLSGTLREDEAQLLNDWLAEDAKHQQLFASLIELRAADWKQVKPSPSPEFLAVQRTRLHGMLAAIDRKEQADQKKNMRVRIAASWLLAAASVMFITFVTLERFSAPTLSHTENRVVNDSTYLSFSHATLGDALRILAEAYGTTVTVNDRILLSKPFTGTFVHEDLETVLHAVCKSLSLTYVKRGNAYVLKRPVS